MPDMFPKASIIRTVNAEPALLFGAGRALLLQLADPAVAQGVHDHSEFKRNPFKRLQGTLEAMNAAVFGSEELAVAVGRRIQRMHDYVVGSGYRANDPEKLLWVHATLVDTALWCYSHLVEPVPEREAYYQEMTRVAEVFGLDRADQPPTYVAFRRWFDERVAALEVTDVGRDLGGFIVDPRLPLRLDLPFRPLLHLQRTFALGSLPPSVRDGFGFAWGDADEARFARAERRVARVFGALPRAVRTAGTTANRTVLLRQAERHVRAAA